MSLIPNESYNPEKPTQKTGVGSTRGNATEQRGFLLCQRDTA